ncbi:MAG TPA: site-2 protease family protein [Verrucomicrobiae bacterium]|nr:site-2 protease family protein [Verrucomicrobiae bacterium]
MNEHESDAPPVINRQLPPAPPVIGSNPPPDLPRPEERPGVADARSESRLKKLLGSLGVVGVLLLKLGAKLKLIILPAIKFFPVLFKTGGTMILSVAAYAMAWGWWFALGFVLLIFVHECGHLLAAKRCGLKVGAPVFIPFMGAFIALKEAPRNAWVEAQVGIGGPLLGAFGAAVCEIVHLLTGNLLFRALAYMGFFLNLFNLAPLGMLDGGRIVTALSPWLWVVGLVIVVGLTILHPSFILFLILVFSAPRVFSLFRRQSEAERRYFEVTPGQRWTMGTLYFGLIALLVLGMQFTHIPRETLPQRGTPSQSGGEGQAVRTAAVGAQLVALKPPATNCVVVRFCGRI